jgi:hypothetical protein
MADFVSHLTQTAIDEKLVDEVVPISGNDALRLARELARQEGIFVGTSAGATLAAALDVARRATAGSNIVCILPDTGERYLSTPLFEDIGEEMDVEELALSRSTPGYRFDVCATPVSIRKAPQKSDLDPVAEDFVSSVIRDNKIVLFSLEWCEFSWSVRKLFSRLGVEYQSVDLDSVAYQAAGRSAPCSRIASAARRFRRSTSAVITLAAAPSYSRKCAPVRCSNACTTVGPPAVMTLTSILTSCCRNGSTRGEDSSACHGAGRSPGDVSAPAGSLGLCAQLREGLFGATRSARPLGPAAGRDQAAHVTATFRTGYFRGCHGTSKYGLLARARQGLDGVLQR